MSGFFRRLFRGRGGNAPASNFVEKPSATAGPSVGETAIRRLSGALTVLATEVWRVRARLAKLSEADRAPLRTLEASSDKMIAALESLGLRIDDPTGRSWDARDSLTVLVFEPTDGVSRATVAETVKPTLFLGESLLAAGEVIVAVPRNDGAKNG